MAHNLFCNFSHNRTLFDRLEFAPRTIMVYLLYLPKTKLLFFILGYFLPFYPCNNPKNTNSKKMKKTPGDITILHKCTKTHDDMLYCSWDIVHDRYNCYFSFWAIFWTFTLLTAWKIKISKKWKKYLEISSFYTSVPKNHDYMLQFLRYGTWRM